MNPDLTIEGGEPLEDDDSPEATADPQADTRQRILDVARDLFAKYGYEGAGIRLITTQAEVNLGAVTYHFKTKEHLYFQVLMSLVGPLGRRIGAQVMTPLAPLERIEGTVRVFFSHIRQHPQMPAIMVRELVSGRPIAGPIKLMMGKVIPLVAATIAEGQKDGSIRAGDPVLLTLSTFAQPVYLNIARTALQEVAGLDFNDADSYARIVDHCVTTVRRQLANHTVT